jgi:micrococcal nuclease
MKKLVVLLVPIFIIGFITLALSKDIKLIGSFKSNKYHRENCIMVKRIEQKNIRIFALPETAIAAGYVPCKICHPPVKTKEN